MNDSGEIPFANWNTPEQTSNIINDIDKNELEYSKNSEQIIDNISITGNSTSKNLNFVFDQSVDRVDGEMYDTTSSF